MKRYVRLPFGAVWYGHQRQDHFRAWVGIYIKHVGELEWHFMR